MEWEEEEEIPFARKREENILCSVIKGPSPAPRAELSGAQKAGHKQHCIRGEREDISLPRTHHNIACHERSSGEREREREKERERERMREKETCYSFSPDM